MHHKNIKAIIKKQLKTNYRGWNRLKKREKRELAKKVLAEVVADYDFSKEIETDKLDLLGIKQQELTSGMMNLEEMARFIEDNKNYDIFKINKIKRKPLYLKDKALRFIDDLLDDTIINRLLAYDGFTPSMRDIFPSNFLRAELLKSIKYPEIRYRKFCGDDKDYIRTQRGQQLYWPRKQAKSCIYRLTAQQEDNDKSCSDEPIQGKLVF